MYKAASISLQSKDKVSMWNMYNNLSVNKQQQNKVNFKTTSDIPGIIIQHFYLEK